MCFLFSNPYSSFWYSCTTQWLYKVTAQLQQCVQGKERRLLIRINIRWHVWAWWDDKADRGPPLQSDLRTAWSQTGNVNSVPVWWDSFTSQWGSRQSVTAASQAAFMVLHSTWNTFCICHPQKKKKTEECTLRHKFCKTLYCRGSFNISYVKALQGFRFTLVLNFKCDVGCFSEQRPNNVAASWENMQEWLPIKEKNVCVKSQDL